MTGRRGRVLIHLCHLVEGCSIAHTFKLTRGDLSQRAFPTVLVFGVEAADRVVPGGVGEGAAIHHLSGQHSFLCEDDLRLLLGQRQLRLLVGYPTQLYHTVDSVSQNFITYVF